MKPELAIVLIGMAAGLLTAVIVAAVMKWRGCPAAGKTGAGMGILAAFVAATVTLLGFMHNVSNDTYVYSHGKKVVKDLPEGVLLWKADLHRRGIIVDRCDGLTIFPIEHYVAATFYVRKSSVVTTRRTIIVRATVEKEKTPEAFLRRKFLSQNGDYPDLYDLSDRMLEHFKATRQFELAALDDVSSDQQQAHLKAIVGETLAPDLEHYGLCLLDARFEFMDESDLVDSLL